MPKLLILGAGPCGLGAALRLRQIGFPDYLICEAMGDVGGLGRSIVDDQGFTWDIGGHVIFSHYEFFDDLMRIALGDDVHRISRHARIWTHGRWIPYPFQNNVHHLPPEAALDCILGAMRADKNPPSEPPGNFYDWTVATLGEGIARQLSRPFNEKVWRVPMEEMSWSWIGDRVSVIDAERLVTNAVLDREDSGWGPNASFVFPKSGGTGAIWQGVADYVGRDQMRFGARAVSIDPAAKKVAFEDGAEIEYEILLSAMPLNRLIALIPGASDDVREAADSLVDNQLELIGLGLEKPLNDESTCWMYFPGDDSPIYRTTNFAHYAAGNVPGGDTSRYSSLLVEAPHSKRMPLNDGDLVEQVIVSLVEAGVMEDEDRGKIISRWRLSIDPAYPVPTLDRDAALDTIQPWLEERGILSRGRMGTWRYEIGNMDHAAQMGKEAVDRVVFGEEESVVKR